MNRLIRNLHQRNLGAQEERERSAQASPLERWLEGRIQEADRHRRERVVLGTKAWQGAMHDWEVGNVTKLAEDYPSLVESYRGDPPATAPDSRTKKRSTSDSSLGFGRRFKSCMRPSRRAEGHRQ